MSERPPEGFEFDPRFPAAVPASGLQIDQWFALDDCPGARELIAIKDGCIDYRYGDGFCGIGPASMLVRPLLPLPDAQPGRRWRLERTEDQRHNEMGWQRPACPGWFWVSEPAGEAIAHLDAPFAESPVVGRSAYAAALARAEAAEARIRELEIDVECAEGSNTLNTGAMHAHMQRANEAEVERDIALMQAARHRDAEQTMQAQLMGVALERDALRSELEATRSLHVATVEALTGMPVDGHREREIAGRVAPEPDVADGSVALEEVCRGK